MACHNLRLDWFAFIACVLASPVAMWTIGTCPLNAKSIEKYSVIFDASSTGTTVHIFNFQLSLNGEIILKQEAIHRETPSLCEVSNITEHLMPLLKNAEKAVPSNKRSVTPISLMATAGLRFLDKKKREEHLDVARKFLKSSGFHYTKKSVGALEGPNEAFYGWLTVAFALNNKNLLNGNITVLDLSGGSAQVAFIPTEKETLGLKSHVHKFKIPGIMEDKKLYANSYPGGLMHSRAAMLRRSAENVKKDEHSLNMVHTCIHPDAGTVHWNYIGVMYNVTGDGGQAFAYQVCYNVVKTFVDEMRVFAPKELKKTRLYLTSYYCSQAAEAGLMGRRDIEKVLLVGDFRKKAEAECSGRSRALKSNEFLCLDLVYIYALLHDGLGLSDDQDVHLVTKVKKLDVGWVLGAGLSALTTVY